METQSMCLTFGNVLCGVSLLGIDQDVGARLDGNEIGVVDGRGGANELQIQVVVDTLLVDLGGRPCATP